MKYWLVKTEPETYSIDDLVRDAVTSWDGVRNYQARNYLRQMMVGDRVLIYHSSSKVIGIAGEATVVREAYADPSQFDRGSDYYDPGSTQAEPRWYCPDLQIAKKFAQTLTLVTIKELKGLEGVALLQRGNRLSVMPLTKDQFMILYSQAAKR